jgi:hypothetical protein
MTGLKKLEYGMIILLSISMLLHYMSATGAAITSVVGFGTLALLYLLFPTFLIYEIPLRRVFKSGRFEGLSKVQISLSMKVGVVLAMTCIALLFELSHWPGGYMQDRVSLIALTVSLVVTYFVKRKFPDFDAVPYYRRILIYLASASLIILVVE